MALAAAALFSVHPIVGVSVNYICGRDLLLMLAFLVAALLVYVRWRRLGGGRWRWPLFGLLLACSLCSKTNSLVAPLLILLFEFTCAGQGLPCGRWIECPRLLIATDAFSPGMKSIPRRNSIWPTL